MSPDLLLAQGLVTAALFGLCWTVQIAVYPAFSRLLATMPAEAFRAYHAGYTTAMGWVAAPLMLAELGLASLWAMDATNRTPALAGLGLIAAIWLLTFALIVPAHSRLQRSPAPADARRLVWLNAVRTALWFARTVLLGAVLAGR